MACNDPRSLTRVIECVRRTGEIDRSVGPGSRFSPPSPALNQLNFLPLIITTREGDSMTLFESR